MSISFSDFINSDLPERFDSRKLILSDLRADTRQMPAIESEEDLINFVSSHPEVLIPPYATLSCIYADWMECQFQNTRGGLV